jgi:hypothetical protein
MTWAIELGAGHAPRDAGEDDLAGTKREEPRPLGRGNRLLRKGRDILSNAPGWFVAEKAPVGCAEQSCAWRSSVSDGEARHRARARMTDLLRHLRRQTRCRV